MLYIYIYIVCVVFCWIRTLLSHGVSGLALVVLGSVVQSYHANAPWVSRGHPNVVAPYMSPDAQAQSACPSSTAACHPDVVACLVRALTDRFSSTLHREAPAGELHSLH